MSLWDTIIGHDWAVSLLRGAVANERIGHAYLFTGPPQVGKTTLARILAQALNCTAPTPSARPCGQCRACQLIGQDRHPDVRLVQGETTGRGRVSLKIEQIRELQANLNLAPYEARSKVALIRQFDSASAGAANAFLKTLEEPPGRVVILLTASDADSLLPTIVSRCRVMALRPLPAAVIEMALEAHWDVTRPDARLLAHLADGRLGWAVQAAANPELLDARATQLETLHLTLGGDRVFRFQMAEKLARQPEQLPDVLRLWLSWWRDLTLIALSAPGNEALTNIDQQGHLRRVAASWQQAQILTGLRHTRQALWQLEHNANTRLVLENLFLTYPLPG